MTKDDETLQRLLRESRELIERLRLTQEEIAKHLTPVKGDFVPPDKPKSPRNAPQHH